MGVPCRFAHPKGLRSMEEGPKAKLIEAVSKNSKIDFLSRALVLQPPQVRILLNPFPVKMIAYSSSIFLTFKSVYSTLFYFSPCQTAFCS
jgi:hypothetical protein